MGEDQNNLAVGTKEGSKAYLKIVIAVCAVIVIAVGVVLGYKLTHKDTPKETEETKKTGETKKTEDEETPDSDKTYDRIDIRKSVLSKVYSLETGKEVLQEEYSYDAQGRLTQKVVYSYDGSVRYTEYYSYDQNGEKMERWAPSKGGELMDFWFTDITGTGVSVEGYEVYEEEFYDDGSIKEFRVYGDLENLSEDRSKMTLVKKVNWEYDAGKKNIKRVYYMDHGNGHMELTDDLQFELDSQGRVIRCINPNDWNGRENIKSVTEYQYDDRILGSRVIRTVTKGKEIQEDIFEGDRLISEKVVEADGSGWMREYWDPNVNVLPSSFDYPRMESWKQFDALGNETPLYKIEFSEDGRPLRQIDIESGATYIEYQYGSDGQWNAVLVGNDENLPVKVMDIKVDQYGDLTEYSTAVAEAAWAYGAGERYEWKSISLMGSGQ